MSFFLFKGFDNGEREMREGGEDNTKTNFDSLPDFITNALYTRMIETRLGGPSIIFTLALKSPPDMNNLHLMHN